MSAFNCGAESKALKLNRRVHALACCMQTSYLIDCFSSIRCVQKLRTLRLDMNNSWLTNFEYGAAKGLARRVN